MVIELTSTKDDNEFLDKKFPLMEIDHIDYENSLKEAYKRINDLEMKVKELEHRIPHRYTDVKFLNYKSRKRILVRIYLYLFKE